MGLFSAVKFLLMHLYVQFVLAPCFIVYSIVTGRASAFHLTNHICDVMRIKFVKTKESDEVAPGIIHLCNHRSWADFFVDQAICGGDAYLSRMMVWVGTPVSALWGWLSHSTWFFYRRSGIDRQSFGEYLERQWVQRQDFGLIAYPEGTRNQRSQPLRLKSGVLQYAYDFQHPVQVVITCGKDQVINEKKLLFRTGRFCVTALSETLDPRDFGSMEEFVEAVRGLFSATWKQAYEAKVEDCVLVTLPLTPMKPTYTPVPIRSRLLKARLVCALLLMYIAYHFQILDNSKVVPSL